MVGDGRSYCCLHAGAQLGCELEGRGQVARIAWSCGAIIVSYIGNTHVGRIAVMAHVSRSTTASSDGQSCFCLCSGSLPHSSSGNAPYYEGSAYQNCVSK